MKNAKRNNRRARRTRLRFCSEPLEAREWMAGDVAAQFTTPDLSIDDDLSQSTLGFGSSTGGLLDGGGIPEYRAAFRSFDGTGNNRTNPEWGSTDEQLLRIAPAEYGDGAWTPAGADRPSPREISNAIVAQAESTARDRQISAFVYAWGQFIDHDMDLTEPPTSGMEAMPIAVPAGDVYFDPGNSGTQMIPFSRSRYDTTTGTGADNPRQQISQITAFIDGSMVYGSDKATAANLRAFVGGKLRTSVDDLPPTDFSGNFLAGDVRINETNELTSMHALFVREHNWWADRIRRDNFRWNDEQIYQRARAIVIAEIQAIMYNEFVPAVLGEGALQRYDGYDPTVNLSVANEFSAAAFRMHTLINDDVEFFGNDGRAVFEEVSLAEAFNNPDLLRETGIESILKYLASTQTQEFDNQIVESLRNFLFGQPGQGGFDLASLNIQRGRDHGLADYNAVRVAYGLSPVDSFDDISSDPAIQQALEDLYGDVDDIDLWIGGLAEAHVRNSSVGLLVRTIVADQFERLRDGDRFWYETVFSSRDVDRIQRTTLADVIERNTTVSNLQENVFFMEAEVRGRVFLDRDGNGRQGFREPALAFVVVELLDDEGEVIATTRTKFDGRYRFDEFRETGDFQIRIIVPPFLQATTTNPVDVLISRGELTISDVDFGLKPDDSDRVDRSGLSGAL